MEKKNDLIKAIEKTNGDLLHSLNEQDNSSFLNLVSQIKPINSNITTKKNNSTE